MKCINKSMCLFHYIHHHHSGTEIFPICSNWKTPRISVWELFNKISEHIQRKRGEIISKCHISSKNISAKVFLPVLNENTESPIGMFGSSKYVSSFIQHNCYLCHWLTKISKITRKETWAGNMLPPAQLYLQHFLHSWSSMFWPTLEWAITFTHSHPWLSSTTMCHKSLPKYSSFSTVQIGIKRKAERSVLHSNRRHFFGGSRDLPG